MSDDRRSLFDEIADAVAHAVVVSVDHIDEAECLAFSVSVRSGDRTITISMEPSEDGSHPRTWDGRDRDRGAA